MAQHWLSPISHRTDTYEARLRINGAGYTYCGVSASAYAEFLRLLAHNQGRALVYLKRVATDVEKSDEQKPV